jgi:hypothetical protein
MTRSWRRRSVLIAIIIVALSVGLVFSILPYLQPAPANAGSISQTYTHAVGVATSNGPGNFGLTLPDVSASEPFAVTVTVVGGTASFCVMSYQTYFAWASAYNTTSPAGSFPQNDCTYGPTGQTAHETLNFALTPGTWDVVALNYSSSVITVSYSPA